MRGVAISVLLMIVVGVIILITALSVYNWMVGQNEKVYCYNLYKTNFVNLPEECKKYAFPIEKAFLNYSLEATEEAIAIYIARCWVRANRGELKENITCFSIEIVNESLYNSYLNFTRVEEYIKKYSDVPTNYIIISVCNSKLCPVNKARLLIISYNGSHIIVW